jgi:erythromycin esterase-like protein
MAEPYMYRHPASTVLLLALALTCAGGAAGALYKWTDAQGRVIYSDQPPPPEVKGQQLRAAPPPANPNAAKELAQQEADFRKRHADQAQALAKADKVRATQEQHNQACDQARSNLRSLDQAQVTIYRYNAKGEREAMDDAALASERERLNAWMRDNKCGT